MKNEVTSTLFYSAIIMVALMIPSFLGGIDPLTQACVYLIIDVLIAFYLFNSLNRWGAFSKQAQEPNWKNLLVLSPCVVALLALPISCIFAFNHIYVLNTFDSLYLFLDVLQIICTVLIEEMLFRMIFHRRIRTQNRAKRILISAGVFALFDILFFFQTFDLLSTLISMAFTFLLGIILGAIVEYGHSVYPCMVFHFLYKLLGGGICGLVVPVSKLFVILDYVLPIVAVIYLVIIYFVYFRKKEYYYVR